MDPRNSRSSQAVDSGKPTQKVTRRGFMRLAGLGAGVAAAVGSSLGGARPARAANREEKLVSNAPAANRNFKAIDFSINAWFPGVGERFAEIGVIRWLGIYEETMKGWTPEYMIDRFDQAGVEKGGLLACWAAEGLGGKDCRVEADEVHAVINKYPDRFFGLVGVSPLPGKWSKYYPRTYIKYAVQQLGFKGVHMYPHWFGIKINDRRMYSIYETVTELDIPFVFQAGAGTHQSNSRICGKPQWIDDIVRDFPTIKIVGIHGGGHWTPEMITMANKDPNTYMGMDVPPPSGWKSSGVLDYILQEPFGSIRSEKARDSFTGSDKVFWGTDFPVQDWVESLRQFDELGLPEDIARKVARDNVIKLFKL